MARPQLGDPRADATPGGRRAGCRGSRRPARRGGPRCAERHGRVRRRTSRTRVAREGDGGRRVRRRWERELPPDDVGHRVHAAANGAGGGGKSPSTIIPAEPVLKPWAWPPTTSLVIPPPRASHCARSGRRRSCRRCRSSRFTPMWYAWMPRSRGRHVAGGEGVGVDRVVDDGELQRRRRWRALLGGRAPTRIVQDRSARLPWCTCWRGPGPRCGASGRPPRPGARRPPIDGGGGVDLVGVGRPRARRVRCAHRDAAPRRRRPAPRPRLNDKHRPRGPCSAPWRARTRTGFTQQQQRPSRR